MQINFQPLRPASGERVPSVNRGQERGRFAREFAFLPPCSSRNSRASRPRSAHGGYALLITLVFLAVAVLIFAGIFSWTSSNARVTVQNNQYNMSENAAEAGAETVISRIDRDFINLSITNSAGYTGLPAAIDQSAWPVNYVYSDTNGSTGVVSVVLGMVSSNTVPLGSQYSGLQAYVRPLDVYATATPIGQPQTIPATVHEAMQLASIPMFQFAIFYNVNLEIDPGQTMYIAGPVFCNQNIWEGSSICTYGNTVAAVGTNAPQVADPFAQNYNGTGASTFNQAGQPVNHANALVMPIGTNNSPGAVLSLLSLPPPSFAMGTAPAYSSNGIVYMANQADLVISNFVSGTNSGSSLPTGTNFLVYYQDNGLTRLPYDFYRLKTGVITNYVIPSQVTNIAYAGFSWITNVLFYDWREGWKNGSGPAKPVQAVQINVTNFSLWITNSARNGGSDPLGVNPDPTKVAHAGHHLASLYVYTSVPLTTSQLPAVRLVNGAQLPNPNNSTVPAGFSVATPFPMYVLGNYNSQTFNGSSLGNYGTNGATTYTVPAALLGDAITILSPIWNDSTTTKMPGASSATVNAAMLQGIVASNPNISGNYSGGVENFLRLLEDWSGGPVLTYNGSIIVLFYSQYATNSWQPTGNYYNAPTRHWSFDFNYQNAFKIPPMTPQSKALVRESWTAHQ